MRIIVQMFFIAALLSGCVTSHPEQTIPFPDWNPHIDQPIRQLEEILTKLEQQQPMNYTISNVAFLYDAKLHILFHKFIGELSEAARSSQIEEQQQWLVKRAAKTREACAEYEGGSLAPYSAGEVFINATKERIAEIEKRMAVKGEG